MSTSSVLIVDPVSSGSLYAPHLEAAGVPVHLLDTPRALAAGLRSASTPGALDLAIDLEGDPARLLDFARAQGVRHVIIGSESGVDVAEQLRADLPGAPANHPGTRAARWNKAAMFETLQASPVPSLRSLAVSRSAGHDAALQQAVSLFDDVGKVVVKPSVGAGSVDVRMAHTSDRLLEAIRLLHTSTGFFGESPDALVQEYYPGTEYVVDTFSRDGVHELCAVCVYDKHLSDDGDFVYDRVRWVHSDDPVAVAVADHARGVLDALGMRVGAAHLEIILGADGPRLVDFGARAHGAGHPTRTSRLTGRSQIEAECDYAVALVQGRPDAPAPLTYHLERDGAIVFFSLERPSTCVGAPASALLEALPGVVDARVHATHGQHFPCSRSLLDSLDLGMAFVEAQGPDELDLRCDTLRRTFDDWFEPDD